MWTEFLWAKAKARAWHISRVGTAGGELEIDLASCKRQEEATAGSPRSFLAK